MVPRFLPPPVHLVVVVAAIAVVGSGCNDSSAAKTSSDPWAQAAAFSKTRPLYERPLGDGRKVPNGLADLSAKTCGACHQAQYQEWKTTIHAAAWVDPQFVDEREKGARWMCINCHTPLRVQHEAFAVGLKDDDVERAIEIPNPQFDRDLQQEGITCAGCHVRDGVVHSADRAGRGKLAPHPVQKDSAFVDGSTLCLRCHQANAEYPGKTFVCTFNTGQEWKDGPYFERGKTCVDCHMPSKTRAIAVGAPAREGRAHYWRGSGIPKFPDGPSPPVDANPPGLEVTAEVNATANANGRSSIRFTAKNVRAGHRLPSGDPERILYIDAQFLDATGALLNKDAPRKRVATFRQHWQWHPAPKKLSDNRLAPEEERAFTVEAPLGAAKAKIEVVHERMGAEAAKYHGLVGRYPLAQVTHALEFDLQPAKKVTIPVLSEPVVLTRPR